MTTLYDLLGARPGDDAASLKAAFRSAVKACHPDLHAGDPETQSRFPLIVRANAILRDAEQRRAYDQLLAFELWRRQAKPRPGIISEALRHLASDAIAVALLALALTGGYVLLTQAAKTSVATVQTVENIAPPARAPAETEGQAIGVSRQELHELLEGPGAARAQVDAAKDNAAPETADADPAPDRPSSEARSTNANSGEPNSSEPGSSDPKFYRERGMAAYRNGDLDHALADFDQAIRLDPRSAGAYIDRSIVLYRKTEFERAFADIAAAKRIESSRQPPPSKPPH
jgi:curved DNA-binding protein CbpA